MSRKGIVEEQYQVPVWVITFSDMTTNLLTFFVLLISMGHLRDSSLFDVGRAPMYLESFKRGFGNMEDLNFGNIKIKYFIPGQSGLPEHRTIDAKEEEIHRLFTQVTSSMTSLPSQIVAKTNRIFPTNIRFAHGGATLDERAKGFLTEFCLNLREHPAGEKIRLYVLGLANDEVVQEQQWILSAMRAQAVADFLKNLLPTDLHLPVYSWGAGPGGDWVEQDSPIYRQSQILIAVLRAGN